MSTSFWCSKCRVDHPGECPPPAVPTTLGPGGPITAHDWQEVPAAAGPPDSYECSKCGRRVRLTTVQAMRLAVDGMVPELPAGPCSGADLPEVLVDALGNLTDQELKDYYLAVKEALLRRLGMDPAKTP